MKAVSKETSWIPSSGCPWTSTLTAVTAVHWNIRDERSEKEVNRGIEEAMGKDINTCSILNIIKHFSPWKCPSAGTGCPRSLWSLHLWRNSKTIWPWAPCSKWPSLSSGVGQNYLCKSLPASSAWSWWHCSVAINNSSWGHIRNSRRYKEIL